MGSIDLTQIQTTIIMKILFVAAFMTAGTVLASEANPTCDVDGNMTYVVKNNNPAFLEQLTANSCTEADLTGSIATTSDATYSAIYTFTIPSTCADAVTGDVTLETFYTAVSGETIIVDSETTTLNCPELESVYTVSHTFSDVVLDHDASPVAEVTDPVEFTMARTQSDYATVESASVNVGDSVYFTITANNDDYEFDLGDCKLSSATDNSAGFTFIDQYDSSVCALSALNASVNKVVTGDNTVWQIQFDVFRFSDTTQNDYVFECNVYACDDDGDDNTRCNDDSGAAYAC